MNFLIKEDRKEENLPSENFLINEDRKEENLPSENSPIKEVRKEESRPSYTDISDATEQTCLQTFWRRFLFLWVLGIGYVILLWHSLSLPYNYCSCVTTSLLADASKGCSSTKDEEREEKNPECGDICRAHYIGLNLPSVGVDQNGMEIGLLEFVSTGNESRDIDHNWATTDETEDMKMASLQTEDSADVTDAVASDQSEHDGEWEPVGETGHPVANSGILVERLQIKEPKNQVPCWTISECPVLDSQCECPVLDSQCECPVLDNQSPVLDHQRVSRVGQLFARVRPSASVPCWTISSQCWTISECPVLDN